MPTASKKRPPMEMEPGEGAAHERGESAKEEVREGTEAGEATSTRKAKSRKRSARGSKQTAAPMDSEGCGCGGKKGATCDGSCGSGMKKGRSDALTAPEYLAACDLGIQGRSRTYIRARLDAFAIREDLKCGKGAISQGEKCHRGPMSGRRATEQLIRTGKVARGWQVRELNWGERFGGDLRNNFGQAVKTSAKTGAIIGGITGAAAGGLPGAAGGALAGGAVGSAFGAVGAPLGAAISATTGYKVSTLERKPKAPKKSHSDSVYASGFSIDTAALDL